MKIKKTAVGVALSLGLACASSAAFAGITIDLFETTGAFIEDTVSDGTSSDTFANSAGGDILGGQRDYSVEDITPGVDDPNTGTRISVFGGKVSWSVDAGNVGMAVFQWDGATDAGDMALNYDLTGVDLSADAAIVFDVEFADIGFDFEIGLYTSATEFTAINLRSDAQPGAQALALSNWTNPLNCLIPDNPGAPAGGVVSVDCGAAGVVDLTDVAAIQITLESLQGVGSVDLIVRSAETVPAPGVLALMGLGLAAGGFASRRRLRRA